MMMKPHGIKTMFKRKVKFQVDSGGFTPTKAYPNDAGWDLYCPDTYIFCTLSSVITVDTKVHVQLPKGYFGLILPRSSTSKRGIHVYAGVIDQGYRGTLKIQISNLINMPVKGFSRGERIAQLIVIPYLNNTAEFGNIKFDTTRGSKSIGSSGK